MSIVVKRLAYVHPDREWLFRDVSFAVGRGEKVALIGNNGSGKSTLLKLLGDCLPVSEGEIVCSCTPYYVPQHFGQYSGQTVARALQADLKLEALHAILEGDVSDNHFSALADDWTIEERMLAALSSWGLEHVSPYQTLDSLSGGEKSRVFLAGITLHNPTVILLDEPTNHLDREGRQQVYEFVDRLQSTLLVVSHDRELLNRLSSMYELSPEGVNCYPGNYESYKELKEQEADLLVRKLDEKAKALRLARKSAREATEHQQKHDVRGQKSNQKKGVGRMAMNTLKDKAEKSTSRLKDVHAKKVETMSRELSGLRASQPDLRGMKTDFGNSVLHTGKILLSAENLNFAYGKVNLWKSPLNFQIRSGDRIAVCGKNGSGKTTFLKLITGLLKPTAGALQRADFTSVYLDQEYSLIDNALSVYDQLLRFNGDMPEQVLKTILNRYLFSQEVWNKSCACLSGGEKMRLSLCCLMVRAAVPDLFILDEPTNNIDLRNVEILTETVKTFSGTLLLVSHDSYFMRQAGIDAQIDLDEYV